MAFGYYIWSFVLKFWTSLNCHYKWLTLHIRVQYIISGVYCIRFIVSLPWREAQRRSEWPRRVEKPRWPPSPRTRRPRFGRSYGRRRRRVGGSGGRDACGNRPTSWCPKQLRRPCTDCRWMAADCDPNWEKSSMDKYPRWKNSCYLVVFFLFLFFLLDPCLPLQHCQASAPCLAKHAIMSQGLNLVNSVCSTPADDGRHLIIGVREKIPLTDLGEECLAFACFNSAQKCGRRRRMWRTNWSRRRKRKFILTIGLVAHRPLAAWLTVWAERARGESGDLRRPAKATNSLGSSARQSIEYRS